MSSDKLDRTRGGAGELNEADKGYYEELYTDLPKEVVDILMQTHPLMGKNDDAGATAYRTQPRSRRPQREDVEEVREARMQQVGNEINEISKAPQQEGDPTRYVSRRARNMEDQTAAPRAAAQEDEYDDGIQYVSVMPARKKSKIVEEVTLQTTAAPASRRRKSREPQPFEDMGRDARDNRPRYESLDFEERAKQEHLDSLYDSDYDDEDEFRGRSKLAIVLGVLAVVVIIVLIFRMVSINSKMQEMQSQITQAEEYKAKYEQVQLEKMQVEEELANLKNPDANAATNAENSGDGNTGSTGGDTSSTGGSTTAGTTSSGYTEYTVQSGDTAWTIAQKVLGNGAQYQKILDANGLKESDALQIGSTIKIPK